jgi:hypothetical protein
MSPHAVLAVTLKHCSVAIESSIDVGERHSTPPEPAADSITEIGETGGGKAVPWRFPATSGI